MTNLEDRAATNDRREEEAAVCKTNQQPPAARARYEQSFPKGSVQGDDIKGRTIASTSIPDHTHDATTIDEAAQSTYSYDSTRDWSKFFKEIDGRRFSSQAAVYILPAGE
jgi:hypothetical protein